MAVGPVSSLPASKISILVPLIALPSSAFFTTRYSQPLARNSFRSLVSASTLSPRKSASTRLCALASFALSMSMLLCFSALSTEILLCRTDFLTLTSRLELGDDRRRVELHAGAHGRRHGHRLHISALRRCR